MTHQPTIEHFWQTYLATLPSDAEPTALPEAWIFGDSPCLADELATLIMAGTKTATCAALWEYEADGEPLPPDTWATENYPPNMPHRPQSAGAAGSVRGDWRPRRRPALSRWALRPGDQLPRVLRCG